MLHPSSERPRTVTDCYPDLSKQKSDPKCNAVDLSFGDFSGHAQVQPFRESKPTQPLPRPQDLAAFGRGWPEGGQRLRTGRGSL